MDLTLFVGMVGSYNDISVLQRSPVFGWLEKGNCPKVKFEVNVHQYTKGYYLVITHKFRGSRQSSWIVFHPNLLVRYKRRQRIL